MSQLLATMFTMTTYGTWLRGDRRGWVDDGVIMPANPIMQDTERARMKHAPYLFEREQSNAIGAMIGESLQSRLSQRLLALTVQTWHVHLVVAASEHRPPDIVKCAKEAVRYGLRPDRPIWSDDYDKRFCFDESSLIARVKYVERHNIALGLLPAPWSFIRPL